MTLGEYTSVYLHTNFGSICNSLELFTVDAASMSYRLSIKSDENEQVMRSVVKEVKGLNPTFDAADIRGKVHAQ